MKRHYRFKNIAEASFFGRTATEKDKENIKEEIAFLSQEVILLIKEISEYSNKFKQAQDIIEEIQLFQAVLKENKN